MSIHHINYNSNLFKVPFYCLSGGHLVKVNFVVKKTRERCSHALSPHHTDLLGNGLTANWTGLRQGQRSVLVPAPPDDDDTVRIISNFRIDLHNLRNWDMSPSLRRCFRFTIPSNNGEMLQWAAS